MGTEDESQLTLQARATAAAGAALVAACIVNPLDVIKTRIQAQAMADSLGGQQAGGSGGGRGSSSSCTAPWSCSSTLYDQVAWQQHQHQHRLQQLHGLIECQHQHQPPTPATAAEQARRILLRHSHTLQADGGVHWAASSSASSSRPATAAAASAAASAVRSAAADGASAASAALRRWGITEGPLPVRRTPPFPVPNGWVPAPVVAAVRAATAGACGCAPHPGAAAAAAAAGGGAGAAAGPLHLQAPPPNPNSMWEMAKGISRREGLPVLWRGTSASLLIAVPMVGIYMPLYDTLLHAWAGSLGGLAPVVSGTAARASACFCVAPFELLRTRLQASAVAGVSIRSTLSGIVTEHATAAAAATAAVQPGGGGSGSWPLQPHQQQPQPPTRAVSVLRAVPRMWTGFSATLVRDVPFSALYWALVEPLRQAMLPLNSHWKPLEQLAASQHARQAARAARSGRPYVPASQQHLHHTQLEILIANMVSGFVAGGLAAGLTTPFDVVKTRMQIASPQQAAAQLSGSSGGSSSGGIGSIRVFAILRDVYARDGLEGLFAGLRPRAARAAPACAIVVSVYELLKARLSQQREDW